MLLLLLCYFTTHLPLMRRVDRRIALVGNRLASLPTAFAGLSRLRYLTLRSNAFSVFPEVVSLENAV